MTRTILAIQADLSRARRRVMQLEIEEHRIICKYPCSLCKAKSGYPCRKNTFGGKRGPHAERRRTALESEYE